MPTCYASPCSDSLNHRDTAGKNSATRIGVISRPARGATRGLGSMRCWRVCPGGIRSDGRVIGVSPPDPCQT
jgi:hypothetical protein